jgi:hypothetical protein
MELIFRFFEFIFRIIYVYVCYVFPVLLLISLICVFFGMALKVGINAGFGILIVLASIIVFSYIVYGSETSFNILQKVWNKITGFFFSGYSILSGANNTNNANTSSKDNNN